MYLNVHIVTNTLIETKSSDQFPSYSLIKEVSDDALYKNYSFAISTLQNVERG